MQNMSAAHAARQTIKCLILVAFLSVSVDAYQSDQVRVWMHSCGCLQHTQKRCQSQMNALGTPQALPSVFSHIQDPSRLTLQDLLSLTQAPPPLADFPHTPAYILSHASSGVLDLSALPPAPDVSRGSGRHT